MARLIILARYSSVRQVNIEGSITTIGRSGSNSVCIDSVRVSRHHAAIEWTGDRFMLTDMGSRNGTYVNNEKVRAHALFNGDAIVIGDCQLRFLYSHSLLPVDALRLEPLPGHPVQLDAYVARSAGNRRMAERRALAR
jgi:pSer/pThr/pTyr-binding forkhead associated (FHA) protein